MINAEQFIRPATLEKALELLKQEGAVVLAGGTSLSRTKDPNIRIVVDLSDTDELKSVQITDDSIEFGSMVTMTEIRKNKDLPESLVSAAKAVSSTPIRNMTTVGGEVARGVYWLDFTVMLMAFDAQIELRSLTGARQISLSEMYKDHPSKIIKPDEIITRIIIKKKYEKSSFIKFAKTLNDYAILNIGVCGTEKDGKTEEVKLAIGAVTNLAMRLTETEKFLKGAEISAETFEKAAEKAVNEIKFRSDFRVSKDYQMQLTKNLTARVLKQAFGISEEN